MVPSIWPLIAADWPKTATLASRHTNTNLTNLIEAPYIQVSVRMAGIVTRRSRFRLSGAARFDASDLLWAQAAARDFQVVMRLQVHPELGSVAEIQA